MYVLGNTRLLLKAYVWHSHASSVMQALRKTGSGCSLDENNLERLFWRENHAARTQLLYRRGLQQPLRQLCFAPVREVCQIAYLTNNTSLPLPSPWVVRGTFGCC